MRLAGGTYHLALLQAGASDLQCPVQHLHMVAGQVGAAGARGKRLCLSLHHTVYLWHTRRCSIKWTTEEPTHLCHAQQAGAVVLVYRRHVSGGQLEVTVQQARHRAPEQLPLDGKPAASPAAATGAQSVCSWRSEAGRWDAGAGVQEAPFKTALAAEHAAGPALALA